MERKKVLIYGFGEAGKLILKDLLSRGNYEVLGFVDDDPSKLDEEFMGYKVLSTGEGLGKLLENLHVDEVIVAIPSAPFETVVEIHGRLVKLGIPNVKILPRSYVDEKVVFLRQTVDVDVEYMLKPKTYEFDMKPLKEFYRGRSILITGAAGSIGSHLARRLLDMEVERVVAFDVDESRLYELKLELPEVEIFLGNVCIMEDVLEAFGRFKFDMVFHTAAYKHVPILEEFPKQAFRTNVLGTLNVLEVSKKHGVSKLVFVSTDKAVHPKSIMGITKRLGEILTGAFGYTSVRFGNVIGSRGSLIPTVIRKLSEGKPVEITHPEARRFFMSIYEAVLLMLYAMKIAKGGETFVLNMGEDVSIVEVVRKIANAMGYDEDALKLKFVGLRKGEKLREELSDGELVETDMEGIFVCKEQPDVEFLLERLEDYGISGSELELLEDKLRTLGIV